MCLLKIDVDWFQLFFSEKNSNLCWTQLEQVRKCPFWKGGVDGAVYE
jgi:hypothetical protein